MDFVEAYEIFTEYVFDNQTIDMESYYTADGGQRESQFDKQMEEKEKLNQTSQSVLKLYNIVSPDIRRSYAERFLQVVNSCDICCAERFFRSFSVNEIKYEQTVQNIQSALHIYQWIDMPLQLSGMQLTLQYVYNRLLLYPDAIMQINDIKVTSASSATISTDNSHQNEHDYDDNDNEVEETSTVSCSYVYNGTRVYDLPHDIVLFSDQQTKQILTENSVKKSCKRKRNNSNEEECTFPQPCDGNSNAMMMCAGDNKTQVSANKTQVSANKTQVSSNQLYHQSYIPACRDNSSVIYNTDIHQRIAMCRLLPKPVRMTAKGNIVMHLNAYNAITHLSFSFHYCDVVSQ